jgi:glycosyltransferase involved in cell wall biosynthesis
VRLAIGFNRLGPYHVARLRAAAARFDVVAVELVRQDDEYAWDVIDDVDGFHRVTLFPRTPAKREAALRVSETLDRIDPAAVAVPGWAGSLALPMIRWALRRGRPAVLMSASTAIDAPRFAPVETLKSLVVRAFSSALVGGEPQRRYVVQLGMPPDRVFPGYDAIDHHHFARTGSDATRPPPVDVAAPFFLASARFIPKKNLLRLVDAFARYRAGRPSRPWALVILGDGPLRGAIEARIRKHGLDDAVRLPGFRQYGELPAWYARAGAFVHASTAEQWGLVVNEAMAAGLPVLVSRACGCAEDLVRDGVNGFTFDPLDVEGLARLLARVAPDEAGRATMGAASREIIARWGPERFADGLRDAVEAARRAPAPRRRLVPTAATWLAARR